MAEVVLLGQLYSEPAGKNKEFMSWAQKDHIDPHHQQQKHNKSTTKAQKIVSSFFFKLKMGNFYMWLMLVQMRNFNFVNICCDRG